MTEWDGACETLAQTSTHELLLALHRAAHPHCTFADNAGALIGDDKQADGDIANAHHDTHNNSEAGGLPRGPLTPSRLANSSAGSPAPLARRFSPSLTTATTTITTTTTAANASISAAVTAEAESVRRRERRRRAAVFSAAFSPSVSRRLAQREGAGESLILLPVPAHIKNERGNRSSSNNGNRNNTSAHAERGGGGQVIERRRLASLRGGKRVAVTAEKRLLFELLRDARANLPDTVSRTLLDVLSAPVLAASTFGVGGSTRAKRIIGAAARDAKQQSNDEEDSLLYGAPRRASVSPSLTDAAAAGTTSGDGKLSKQQDAARTRNTEAATGVVKGILKYPSAANTTDSGMDSGPSPNGASDVSTSSLFSSSSLAEMTIEEKMLYIILRTGKYAGVRHPSSVAAVKRTGRSSNFEMDGGEAITTYSPYPDKAPRAADRSRDDAGGEHWAPCFYGTETDSLFERLGTDANNSIPNINVNTCHTGSSSSGSDESSACSSADSLPQKSRRVGDGRETVCCARERGVGQREEQEQQQQQRHSGGNAGEALGAAFPLGSGASGGGSNCSSDDNDNDNDDDDGCDSDEELRATRAERAYWEWKCLVTGAAAVPGSCAQSHRHHHHDAYRHSSDLSCGSYTAPPALTPPPPSVSHEGSEENNRGTAQQSRLLPYGVKRPSAVVRGHRRHPHPSSPPPLLAGPLSVALSPACVRLVESSPAFRQTIMWSLEADPVVAAATVACVSYPHSSSSLQGFFLHRVENNNNSVSSGGAFPTPSSLVTSSYTSAINPEMGYVERNTFLSALLVQEGHPWDRNHRSSSSSSENGNRTDAPVTAQSSSASSLSTTAAVQKASPLALLLAAVQKVYQQEGSGSIGELAAAAAATTHRDWLPGGSLPPLSPSSLSLSSSSSSAGWLWHALLLSSFASEAEWRSSQAFTSLVERTHCPWSAVAAAARDGREGENHHNSRSHVQQRSSDGAALTPAVSSSWLNADFSSGAEDPLVSKLFERATRRISKSRQRLPSPSTPAAAAAEQQHPQTADGATAAAPPLMANGSSAVSPLPLPLFSLFTPLYGAHECAMIHTALHRSVVGAEDPHYLTVLLRDPRFSEGSTKPTRSRESEDEEDDNGDGGGNAEFGANNGGASGERSRRKRPSPGCDGHPTEVCIRLSDIFLRTLGGDADSSAAESGKEGGEGPCAAAADGACTPPRKSQRCERKPKHGPKTDAHDGKPRHTSLSATTAATGARKRTAATRGVLSLLQWACEHGTLWLRLSRLCDLAEQPTQRAALGCYGVCAAAALRRLLSLLRRQAFALGDTHHHHHHHVDSSSGGGGGGGARRVSFDDVLAARERLQTAIADPLALLARVFGVHAGAGWEARGALLAHMSSARVLSAIFSLLSEQQVSKTIAHAAVGAAGAPIHHQHHHSYGAAARGASASGSGWATVQQAEAAWRQQQWRLERHEALLLGASQHPEGREESSGASQRKNSGGVGGGKGQQQQQQPLSNPLVNADLEAAAFEAQQRLTLLSAPADVLAYLFTSAARPLNAMLRVWLTTGRAPRDATDDFFIVSSHGATTSGFSLDTSPERLPCFVAPAAAAALLEAGLAVRTLRLAATHIAVRAAQEERRLRQLLLSWMPDAGLGVCGGSIGGAEGTAAAAETLSFAPELPPSADALHRRAVMDEETARQERDGAAAIAAVCREFLCRLAGQDDGGGCKGHNDGRGIDGDDGDGVVAGGKEEKVGREGPAWGAPLLPLPLVDPVAAGGGVGYWCDFYESCNDVLVRAVAAPSASSLSSSSSSPSPNSTRSASPASNDDGRAAGDTNEGKSQASGARNANGRASGEAASQSRRAVSEDGSVVVVMEEEGMRRVSGVREPHNENEEDEEENRRRREPSEARSHISIDMDSDLGDDAAVAAAKGKQHQTGESPSGMGSNIHDPSHFPSSHALSPSSSLSSPRAANSSSSSSSGCGGSSSAASSILGLRRAHRSVQHRIRQRQRGDAADDSLSSSSFSSVSSVSSTYASSATTTSSRSSRVMSALYGAMSFEMRLGRGGRSSRAVGDVTAAPTGTARRSNATTTTTNDNSSGSGVILDAGGQTAESINAAAAAMAEAYESQVRRRAWVARREQWRAARLALQHPRLVEMQRCLASVRQAHETALEAIEETAASASSAAAEAAEKHSKDEVQQQSAGEEKTEGGRNAAETTAVDAEEQKNENKLLGAFVIPLSAAHLSRLSRRRRRIHPLYPPQDSDPSGESSRTSSGESSSSSNTSSDNDDDNDGDRVEAGESGSTADGQKKKKKAKGQTWKDHEAASATNLSSQRRRRRVMFDVPGATNNGGGTGGREAGGAGDSEKKEEEGSEDSHQGGDTAAIVSSDSSSGSNANSDAELFSDSPYNVRPGEFALLRFRLKRRMPPPSTTTTTTTGKERESGDDASARVASSTFPSSSTNATTADGAATTTHVAAPSVANLQKLKEQQGANEPKRDASTENEENEEDTPILAQQQRRHCSSVPSQGPISESLRAYLAQVTSPNDTNSSNTPTPGNTIHNNNNNSNNHNGNGTTQQDGASTGCCRYDAQGYCHPDAMYVVGDLNEDCLAGHGGSAGRRVMGRWSQAAYEELLSNMEKELRGWNADSVVGASVAAYRCPSRHGTETHGDDSGGGGGVRGDGCHHHLHRHGQCDDDLFSSSSHQHSPLPGDATANAFLARCRRMGAVLASKVGRGGGSGSRSGRVTSRSDTATPRHGRVHSAEDPDAAKAKKEEEEEEEDEQRWRYFSTTSWYEDLTLDFFDTALDVSPPAAPGQRQTCPPPSQQQQQQQWRDTLSAFRVLTDDRLDAIFLGAPHAWSSPSCSKTVEQLWGNKRSGGGGDDDDDDNSDSTARRKGKTTGGRSSRRVGDSDSYVAAGGSSSPSRKSITSGVNASGSVETLALSEKQTAALLRCSHYYLHLGRCVRDFISRKALQFLLLPPFGPLHTLTSQLMEVLLLQNTRAAAALSAVWSDAIDEAYESTVEEAVLVALEDEWGRRQQRQQRGQGRQGKAESPAPLGSRSRQRSEEQWRAGGEYSDDNEEEEDELAYYGSPAAMQAELHAAARVDYWRSVATRLSAEVARWWAEAGEGEGQGAGGGAEELQWAMTEEAAATGGGGGRAAGSAAAGKSSGGGGVSGARFMSPVSFLATLRIRDVDEAESRLLRSRLPAFGAGGGDGSGGGGTTVGGNNSASSSGSAGSGMAALLPRGFLRDYQDLFCTALFWKAAERLQTQVWRLSHECGVPDVFFLLSCSRQALRHLQAFFWDRCRAAAAAHRATALSVSPPTSRRAGASAGVDLATAHARFLRDCRFAALLTEPLFRPARGVVLSVVRQLEETELTLRLALHRVWAARAAEEAAGRRLRDRCDALRLLLQQQQQRQQQQQEEDGELQGSRSAGSWRGKQHGDGGAGSRGSSSVGRRRRGSSVSASHGGRRGGGAGGSGKTPQARPWVAPSSAVAPSYIPDLDSSVRPAAAVAKTGSRRRGSAPTHVTTRGKSAAAEKSPRAGLGGGGGGGGERRRKKRKKVTERTGSCGSSDTDDIDSHDNSNASSRSKSSNSKRKQRHRSSQHQEGRSTPDDAEALLRAAEAALAAHEAASPGRLAAAAAAQQRRVRDAVRERLRALAQLLELLLAQLQQVERQCTAAAAAAAVSVSPAASHGAGVQMLLRELGVAAESSSSVGNASTSSTTATAAAVAPATGGVTGEWAGAEAEERAVYARETLRGRARLLAGLVASLEPLLGVLLSRQC